MKEINLPSGNYIFCLVPNDAKDFEILNKGFNRSSALLNICWNNEEKCIPYINEKAPFKLYEEEDFKIISTTKDITEEQAESIVEKYTEYETEEEQLLDGMYVDYLEKGNYWVQNSAGIRLWAFKTAKESLQSLIQANGLDITKTYLILLKL